MDHDSTIRVDLHLHSTASDGQYPPAELVQMALKKGLRVIALTDHDTTEGLEEALNAAHGSDLMVIPGIELSTDVPGQYEVHILGYWIDWHNPLFQERLTTMRQSRLHRARQVWERLVQIGCPLSWERLLAIAGGGAVGRPHIAQALIEAGYAESLQDAFQRYIGRNAPAYVTRPKLLPQQAIELVRQAQGLPVLAHPAQIIERIPMLAQAGLVGLEAYYDGYPQAQKEFLARLARKHNLIATGGSDFHGPDNVGTSDLGQVDVPYAAVIELQAAYHKNPSVQPK